MPWEERKVSQVREEFVKRVLAQETTKSALCREYGISRPTGDKWIARYLAGEVLEDRSRVPKRSPGKTAEDMESLIVGYRQTHPHSWFNLCCQAQYTETFEEIKPVMVRLFWEYGLPSTVGSAIRRPREKRRASTAP